MAKDLLQIHLTFLKSLLDFAFAQHWRVVVSGGYAIDGALKKITRRHNDIDVLIYGKTPRLEASHMLATHYKNYFQSSMIDLKNETFYVNLDIHFNNFVANTYYIQTKPDPFESLQTVVKSDGEVVVNRLSDFPLPIKGVLSGINVEVENPITRLNDIMTKRQTLTNYPKHEGDIENLQKLIDTTNNSL